jgi:hypothetical protein
MAKNACCTYPYCEEPRDADRDTTMCEDHSARWLRSEDFAKACRDDGVRGYMSLGLRKAALREVAKFRRRWAKAEAKREGGE